MMSAVAQIIGASLAGVDGVNVTWHDIAKQTVDR